MSESAPRYVTCRCEHCDGGIEFDANELGEANSLLSCPHCGVETLLLVPQDADLASQPVVTAPPLPSETQKGQHWVIVDTETDGLTAPIHVVEIAAQLMEGWESCGEPFQVFLNHNVHIPWSAVAIHGYTQEFLRANGRPPMEAHEAFRRYAGEFPIVAHSLGYDWNRALVPEWSRLGLKPAGCRGFCTVTLSRRVLPEADSYSLDELKSRFGLGSGPSHKAKADVETVVRLFREILRPRLESAGLTTFEAWRQFAQRTPVADCWHLIDPRRKPEEQQCNLNARQVPKDDPLPTESSTAPLADSKPILKRVSRLANLTEASIRNRTKNGNSPLHMAAKNGRINEIPNQLFQLELFMAKNNRDETPLHFAAHHGHLAQVPREFLTRETLMVLDCDGRMPLHVAAAYGHLNQIPKEFLTPDLLSIPTQGTKDTVLHYAALSNQPAVIPKNCISPGMWKVKNCFGLTPRDYLDAARSSANNAPEKLKIQTQASEQRPVSKGKMERIPLAKLTEETIRARTKTGDTPLHRAARTGRISEIPRQLLQTELFMARNNSFSRETPLHLAAKYGHLDKVPREFLTRETLTASTEYEKKESCTGSTPPRTETPLHVAARCGHADQIPKEFLTPEFLSIEASGYRTTVLHDLAYSKRLDLVPDIYANSEMWNLIDSTGRTPREALEGTIQRETYVAAVRDEPATEKQKEKLRWFGCSWDEGITKGQASDALDACASQFPDRDAEYYSRPATEDQKAKLRSFRKNPDDNRRDGPLTYGEAKDLIADCEREAQRKHLDSL